MCFPTDISPRIISYIHNSKTMYTYQNKKKKMVAIERRWLLLRGVHPFWSENRNKLHVQAKQIHIYTSVSGVTV